MEVGKQQTNTSKDKDSITFPLSELSKHSRELFGVNPEVLAGAFYDAKSDDLFSKEEAKVKIEKFLKKEVI